MKECVTHHNACDCREEYFRRLQMWALDARECLLTWSALVDKGIFKHPWNRKARKVLEKYKEIK